jgi:hypothetical protein
LDPLSESETDAPFPIIAWDWVSGWSLPLPASSWNTTRRSAQFS